jgi:hypothetical protein
MIYIRNAKVKLVALVCMVCLYFKLHNIVREESRPPPQSRVRVIDRDTNLTSIRTKIRIESSSLKERPCKNFVSKNFKAVNFNVKGKYFKLDGVVHPHDPIFTIQPEIRVCTANAEDEQKILILSFVIVGVEFFEMRNIIRNSWANRSLYDEYDMQVFFMVGFSRDDKINQMVREEARIYKDILQVNYIDSYHFMTAKIMSAFKWASTFCKNTHFLLRINDGIVVNTRLVIRYFKAKVNRAMSEAKRFQNALAGHLVYNEPVPRDKTGKFFVTHEEIRGEFYMPYIAGEFYFVTSDLAAKYLNLSQYVHRPPFSVWMEDIFVTMLSLHLGVVLVKLNGLFHHYVHTDNSIQILQELKIEKVYFFHVYQRHFFQPVWDYFRAHSNKTLLH